MGYDKLERYRTRLVDSATSSMNKIEYKANVTSIVVSLHYIPSAHVSIVPTPDSVRGLALPSV